MTLIRITAGFLVGVAFSFGPVVGCAVLVLTAFVWALDAHP